MISDDAQRQYQIAQKEGTRYVNDAISRGENPYLPALDDIVDTVKLNAQYLGYMDIPMDLIKGTKTRGRQDAFAGNFMPLLGEGTEFRAKWVQLCDSHFDEGIHDPIVVLEYYGKFYVQEGNKRVSVLKSLGARAIYAQVTRLNPEPSDSHDYKVYKEFIKFYSLSKTYLVWFTHRTMYAKLQSALGFEPEHVWTDEERQAFTSRFYFFKNVFTEKQKSDPHDIDVSTALLCWLQVFPYECLKTYTNKQLIDSLNKVWPEISYLSRHQKEELSIEPVSSEKNFFARLFASTRSSLCVAFVYAATTGGSNWVHGHEMSAEYLKQQLGDRVVVKNYYADPDNADEVMNRVVSDGADVMFVTAPTLIGATRRIKTLHPDIFVLVCALAMPMAGVRTYYARSYEAKFISGAIAGAMSDANEIGFIAKYPIYGVPAEINAFALGARMTNPDVRIKLKWTCLPGNPEEELLNEGVTVFSSHDIISRTELKDNESVGTYMYENGVFVPLSAPKWNWGTFYEKVVRFILSGEWDPEDDNDKSLTYWWGLSSGVMDVYLSNELPDSAKQLGNILKQGIIHNTFDIFGGPLKDNKGRTQNDGTKALSLEEIKKMRWLLDNVDGKVPEFEELLPMAQGLTRILGVYRKHIAPGKEGFII
ncbi:MAG: BMP family ABC transporter substrate-binding protein [Eubacteriales bacterium]|nr:BMP family ABC transporter substrate-binding protein [Eubacteriales bacterium]